MDYSLTKLLIQSAHHLLATSSVFEPYIPSSQKNTHCALQLLGSLAETTRASLTQARKPPKPQPEAEAQPPTRKVGQQPPSLNDKSVLEALLALRNSSQSFKRSPGIYSTIIRGTRS